MPSSAGHLPTGRPVHSEAIMQCSYPTPPGGLCLRIYDMRLLICVNRAGYEAADMVVMVSE